MSCQSKTFEEFHFIEEREKLLARKKHASSKQTGMAQASTARKSRNMQRLSRKHLLLVTFGRCIFNVSKLLGLSMSEILKLGGGGLS